MKIAFVSGHFIPELGYQEVYLARALAGLGHEVHVFTSAVIPFGYRHKNISADRPGTYHDDKSSLVIRRLPVVFSAGTWVYSLRLGTEVENFDPDMVIVQAAGKLFPWPVLRKDKKYRLVVMMGNNSDYLNWHSFKSILSSLFDIFKNKLIRNHIYKRAVSAADVVFAYTPETPDVISAFLNISQKELFLKKLKFTSLGFDPGVFYFDETGYRRTRDLLGIPYEAVVFATSTRINPNKRIEAIIDGFQPLDLPGCEIHYILTGFDNNKYNTALKTYISERLKHIKVHFFPFSGHAQLRKIFSASDAGIWVKPAISIIESMGCGLKVMLEKKSSLDHLLDEKADGWYFTKDSLPEILETAIFEIRKKEMPERIRLKKELSAINAGRFSYYFLAKRITGEDN